MPFRSKHSVQDPRKAGAAAVAARELPLLWRERISRAGLRLTTLGMLGLMYNVLYNRWWAFALATIALLGGIVVWLLYMPTDAESASQRAETGR